MNTHDREIPVDSASVDAQRWQAQEKARRLDPDADPVDLRIAKALRRAPPVDLRVDFAAQVAALAHMQATTTEIPEYSQLEQRLLRGLVIVFALAAAVVVAWLGRGWVADLAAVLPGGGDAVAWIGVAALCLLGNWSVGLLRGQYARGANAA